MVRRWPVSAKTAKRGRVGGTTAVFRADRMALYFSKEVIPYSDNVATDGDHTPVFHHVGVYAYRPAALARYGTLPMGKLEELEGLSNCVSSNMVTPSSASRLTGAGDSSGN